MLKHTQSPWSHGKERTEALPGNQLRRFIPIYEINSPHPQWASDDPEQNFPIIAGVHICDEATANARLIAAAPELLKCLEIHSKWFMENGMPECHKSIERVLSIARGES